MITSFSGEYFFLSNFYPALFVFDRREWPSVEHAYQALKTNDVAVQEHIRRMSSAGAAKRAGRVVSLRMDWPVYKGPLMQSLVSCKFLQNPGLKAELLKTGDEKLVEGNTWHDNEWGDCLCEKCSAIVGLNKLGEVLMRVREEAKKSCR